MSGFGSAHSIVESIEEEKDDTIEEVIGVLDKVPGKEGVGSDGQDGFGVTSRLDTDLDREDIRNTR